MAFNGLWLVFALEGNSNYISWKDRMEAVLEDNGLKEVIERDVPKPTSTYAAVLDAWQKKVARARRILLEGVKDHCLKPSWESHSICYVEGFDRAFPKQQRA